MRVRYRRRSALAVWTSCFVLFFLVAPVFFVFLVAPVRVRYPRRVALAVWTAYFCVVFALFFVCGVAVFFVCSICMALFF